jgi:methyltransferase-like protein/cyclopropane fatty-acyl-phospholipid synthase-like methyltransferase
MTDQTMPTSYDLVPYESYPFAQTHPSRLASVATLLGLKPKAVTRCRVLELGCAAGGNLIPMALTLPESTFVGIDLSSRQVDDGLQVIDALRLKNIQLRHLSIADVGADLGTFDYILCHGVYSWVPTHVQDKILEICKRNLHPNGIAYVSYNTYPGWHMRGMIRDMMRYHAKQFTEAQVRTRQARNLLDFLARSVAQENSPYSHLLSSEVESLRQARDSYLFHEHLEDVNDPIYFYEFAERATAKGLRYLGEADFRVMVPSNYPREIEYVLQMLSSDIIHMEQYMDFLRNRTFRQTLLCHDQQTPNYALRPERLAGLYVASPIRPASENPNVTSKDFEDFQGPDGIGLKTCEPFLKAAMLHLGEVWPQAVRFDALRSAARARLESISKEALPPPDTELQMLGQCLLTGYASSSSRLVELFTTAPSFTLQITECPVASPLARLQASTENRVTNLRHESLVFDEVNRHLLRHLDGTNDRAALSDALTRLVQQGDLAIEEAGQPVEDVHAIRSFAEETVGRQLPVLARHALLVS